MRKLKLLLAVAALAFWGSNVHAQTDVTATYLNAGLSSLDGWTVNAGGFSDLGSGKIGDYKVRDGFNAATVDDTHFATDYCFGIECRWATNSTSVNQTTISELPEGRYELTFDVENVNSNTTNATYNNLFYVQVGDKTYGDNTTEWMRGQSSWTTHTISFAITQPAKATVSLGYGTGDNNFPWQNTPALYVSHLKLTKKPFTYKTVYLAPGAWDASDAIERYALYMYNSDTDNAWTSFTEGEGGVWSAQLNDAYSKMIICRMDGANTENNWANKWNQTGNLDAPGADGLLYTMTSTSQESTFTISIPGATLASFTDGGKYLFKNIGSGKYLGPANNAGTQASLIQPSHFNTLHAQTGGAYTIESQVNNGGASYYFSGSYMDSENAAWLNIYQVSEGVYVITPTNSTSILGYDGNTTVLASNLTDYNDDNAQWQIVKYEDALTDATQENPVDATFMVLDQNFDRNNRNQSAWKVNASNSNLCGGEQYNMIAESWRSAFTVSQTITVPNGYYKVRAQAAITEYEATGTDLPVIYVEGAAIASKPFPICTNGNNAMTQFSANFRDGQFYTEWTELVPVTTKSLTVGVKGTRTNSWCVWDNIQLMYYGPLDLSEYVSAYETALANAKAMATTAASAEKVAATWFAALNTAIDTYDKGNVDETDQDALETATTALNAAKEKVEKSIASYAVIARGTVPDNSIEGWTCENSQEFRVNTWSVEGNPGNDPSGMTTPFIQNWVARGSYLGAGKVFYELEGLEPGEVYYAQALVRSYNEANSDAPNGPDFFINDVTTSLVAAGTTFTYNNMSGIYATLGGAANVGSDGTLKLGVVIAENRNYNWVAFKNVSIRPMAAAFNAAVAQVTALEGTIPTAVYNVAYAVVEQYSGDNYPTTAAGFETAIAAIEAAAEAAATVVTPFADFNDLKAEAETLQAVANDNDEANNALETAISEQTTAANAATNADGIGTAKATLKEAMRTYVFAANPVGDGAQFDMTFTLTNPDVTGLPSWQGCDGWYGGQVMETTDQSVWSSDGKNYFYEYWRETATANNEFTIYQQPTLPKGTFTIKCYAVSAQSLKGSGDNTQEVTPAVHGVYFYANDTQGSCVTSTNLTQQEVSFVNDAEQEVKIGLKALTGNTYRWMGIGYLELYKVPAKSYEVDETKAWDNTVAGAGEVTLKRNIMAGLNTLVLPFSMSQAEVEANFGVDSKVYVVEKYNSEKDLISFKSQDGISANKPCLLKATVAGSSYTLADRTIVAGEPVVNATNVNMVGSYAASINVPEGMYIIRRDKFYNVNSTVTLANTRAYIELTTPTPGARVLKTSFDGDMTTGIATLENGELKIETGVIYDLTGRKVNNPAKGVYVINGKKVIK